MRYSQFKIVPGLLLLVLFFCSSCGETVQSQPYSHQSPTTTPFQKYQVDFRQGRTNNWTIDGNHKASSEGLELLNPDPGDAMPVALCPVKVPHIGSYKLSLQAVADTYSIIRLGASSQYILIFLYPNKVGTETNQQAYKDTPLAQTGTGIMATYELDISEQKYQFQINDTVVTQGKLSPYFTSDMTFSINNDNFTLVTFSIEEG